MIENFAADQDEDENERPRSLVGQTSDDHLSELQWKVDCLGCGRLVPAAEREQCGNCVTDGALLGQ